MSIDTTRKKPGNNTDSAGRNEVVAQAALKRLAHFDLPIEIVRDANGTATHAVRDAS